MVKDFEELRGTEPEPKIMVSISAKYVMQNRVKLHALSLKAIE
jgi:hypothetical protein